MDNIDLTEFDEADIMVLDEDVVYSNDDYAFFGSEAGYVHYLVFTEGKTSRFTRED